MSIPRFVIGAVAGLVATVPMTAAMKIMHRLLPEREQYPLPPSEIVAKVSDEAGASHHLDRSEHVAMTYTAHFAYGAAAGALYAPLADRLHLSPALGGVTYGLAVWTTSYLGLLPALGILKPATMHPPRRNALMIAAHVVWGLKMGFVVDLLEPKTIGG